MSLYFCALQTLVVCDTDTYSFLHSFILSFVIYSHSFTDSFVRYRYKSKCLLKTFLHSETAAH